MQSVTRFVDFNSISLLNNILRNECGASKLQKPVNCSKLLTNQDKNICNEFNLNYRLSYLSKEYLESSKSIVHKIKDGQDGLVDSIRLLLCSNFSNND